MELTNKLSYETFVCNAIRALRNEKSKGIHVLYSGFSKAFRDFYGEQSDVRKITDRLVEQKVIVTRPAKGGVMLYLASDAPVLPTNALDKILALSKAETETDESTEDSDIEGEDNHLSSEPANV